MNTDALFLTKCQRAKTIHFIYLSPFPKCSTWPQRPSIGYRLRLWNCLLKGSSSSWERDRVTECRSHVRRHQDGRAKHIAPKKDRGVGQAVFRLGQSATTGASRGC